MCTLQKEAGEKLYEKPGELGETLKNLTKHLKDSMKTLENLKKRLKVSRRMRHMEKHSNTAVN